MATENITIKRRNDANTGWDVANPITVGQNVYGSGTQATTPLFDSNNKINNIFLPATATSSVRYDTNAQGLTSTQKSNARTNIGAGTSNFTGYTSSDKLSTDYISNDANWSSIFISQLYKETDLGDTSLVFSTQAYAPGAFSYNSTYMALVPITSSLELIDLSTVPSVIQSNWSNYKYLLTLRHSGSSLANNWTIEQCLYLKGDGEGASGSIPVNPGDTIRTSNKERPDYYFLEWHIEGTSDIGAIFPAVESPVVGGGGMTNPMTTSGDIITGGTSGTPQRLAKGSDGQVLKVVSGSPAWANDTGKQLYEHNIRIYYSTNNFTVTFKLITDSATAYTYSTLTTSNNKGLYALGFTGSTTVCPACGFYGSSSAQNLIVGVYGYNSTSAYRLYFKYLPLVSYSSPTATINNTVADSATYFTLNSSYTVQDVVRTL